MPANIRIDEFVLRHAISAFEGLIRSPNNRAAQVKASLSLANLKDHLPEVLQAEQERVDAAQR